MSFWLNDISVLFQNYTKFYPNKNMNNIEKANSIMRLSVYYSILLIVLNLDSSWLTVSFLLICISLFIGLSENFNSSYNSTIKPTKDNPYMNFIAGDLMINPNKPPACDITDKTVREKQLKLFRTNKNTGKEIVDYNNLYGTTINDRSFYTMPSTTLVNDQNGFANFLFGDFGKCKSEGKYCLKHRDNRFHRSRYYYQY